MVNTNLDKKYTASAKGAINYDPIPDGDYVLRVKEVDPWKETKKTVQVIQRDENGNALKDANGKNITETVPDCVFYNCNVKFEVVSGEYDGRLIFHNLTTHPNMSWSIDNFLYAIGIQELAASEIQEKTKGAMCYGTVFTDTYTKVVQNKDTGIDEEVERKVNKVKSLRPLMTPQTNNETDELTDLGI